MNFARGVVAALFLAAVVAAGVVVAHGSPVASAGQPVGYVAPVQGQKLLVLGDSFSEAAETGGTSWPVMLAGLNHMQLLQQSAPGTGYYAHSAEGRTFLHRARNIRRQIVNAHTLSRPDWIIVWAAHDDLTQTLEKGLPLPYAQIRSAMLSTLRTLNGLVPHGHLIVIGPVASPADSDMTAVQKLQSTERSAADAAGLSRYYIDPIAGGWFAGNNAAFIGSNQAPTDQGQQNILYFLQRTLRQDPYNFGVGAVTATSIVPPYIPTVTLTPPTQTSVVRSTVTQTSVSHPPARVVTQREVVTQPPVVVTVTVQPTP